MTPIFRSVGTLWKAGSMAKLHRPLYKSSCTVLDVEGPGPITHIWYQTQPHAPFPPLTPVEQHLPVVVGSGNGPRQNLSASPPSPWTRARAEKPGSFWVRGQASHSAINAKEQFELPTTADKASGGPIGTSESDTLLEEPWNHFDLW